MKHKEYLKMINAYVDRELNTAKQNILLSHLKKCKECRNYLKTLEDLKKEIANVVFPSVSNDFERKFWNKVVEMEQIKEQSLLREPVFKIALGCMIGVILGLFIQILFSLHNESLYLTLSLLNNEVDFWEFIIQGGGL